MTLADLAAFALAALLLSTSFGLATAICAGWVAEDLEDFDHADPVTIAQFGALLGAVALFCANAGLALILWRIR